MTPSRRWWPPRWWHKAEACAPHADPSSLGNILQAKGWASSDDVELAVAADGRLGEALIKAGTITGEQLEHALLQQKSKRKKINTREFTLEQMALADRVQNKISAAATEIKQLTDRITKSGKLSPIKRGGSSGGDR